MSNPLPILLVLLSACSFDPPGLSLGGTGSGQADAMVAPPPGSLDAGLPANAFRREIRIAPPSTVAGNVQNVAIPIRLEADTHFAQNAAATGQDILVQTEGGVSLPIDFEILDVGAGELLAWVKAPEIAVTGTRLFLFYGSGQTAPVTDENPWQGLAATVWHLGAIGSGNTAIDSSPSGFDGTKDSIGTFSLGAGVHGNAFDFNQTQFLLATGDVLDWGADDSFAVVFWFNQQQAVSRWDLGFYNGGPIDGVTGYSFSMGRDDWSVGVQDTDGDGAFFFLGDESALGNTGWHQLALVVDRDADVASAYVDGQMVEYEEIDDVGNVASSRQARFGGSANPPDALVDELRAYPSALSPDYMALDYALGADPNVLSITAASAARYPGT